jgi:hypothetical protein
MARVPGQFFESPVDCSRWLRLLVTCSVVAFGFWGYGSSLSRHCICIARFDILAGHEYRALYMPCVAVVLVRMVL